MLKSQMSSKAINMADLSCMGEVGGISQPGKK
jgi:hypothetical protein